MYLMPRDLTLPYSYSTGPLVAMKASEANIPAALNLVQNPSVVSPQLRQVLEEKSSGLNIALLTWTASWKKESSYHGLGTMLP